MNIWAAIEQAVKNARGTRLKISEYLPVSGGDINRCYRLRFQDGRSAFIKLNAAEYIEMFIAEAAGLDALRATNTLRIPETWCYGSHAKQSFLILEYIELNKTGDARRLGMQLAEMHRATQTYFGWESNNYIGRTPQINIATDNWLQFFREHRLAYQLNLAAKRGTSFTAGEHLLNKLDAFFIGYAPQASLLHGDLWAGNYAYDASGRGVLFDPAVYYGDRESDLALSELFGGFPADFYAGYQSVWPLHPGYAQRKPLYQLYHLLNHHHLFGGGYFVQAQTLIIRLLKSL